MCHRLITQHDMLHPKNKMGKKQVLNNKKKNTKKNNLNAERHQKTALKNFTMLSF